MSDQRPDMAEALRQITSGNEPWVTFGKCRLRLGPPSGEGDAIVAMGGQYHRVRRLVEGDGDTFKDYDNGIRRVIHPRDIRATVLQEASR